MQMVANQDPGSPMTKVAGNSSDNSCISVSTDTFTKTKYNLEESNKTTLIQRGSDNEA